MQVIEFARRLDSAKIAAERPEFAKFPVNFPVTGNLSVETGSNGTASATNRSPQGGDFPSGAPQIPTYWRLPCPVELVSHDYSHSASTDVMAVLFISAP